MSQGVLPKLTVARYDLSKARHGAIGEIAMLDEAHIQSHVSKIRDDGFTVIEHAASPELLEALKQALLRTERDRSTKTRN